MSAYRDPPSPPHRPRPPLTVPAKDPLGISATTSASLRLCGFAVGAVMTVVGLVTWVCEWAT